MSTEERHAVRDVFTPTTPARLTFVERHAINDKIVNALRTPGKQVVIYGHSGCGKTTLLANKLDQLFPCHVNTRCMQGMSLESLIIDAFDQLSPFYVSETSAGSKGGISAGLGAEYWGIKGQLEASGERTKEVTKARLLPPQLSAQALARFLGEARCCWVLEDFHKVEEGQKTRLSQMMKVFMDSADTYPQLKILAVGAVDTARQVVQYDVEMRNRVSEVHVPLMTNEEMLGIIEKGEALLNVRIDPKVKSVIAHYSNGLASVCHQLCLHLCVAAGIQETTDAELALGPEEFSAGLAQYLEDASDTLKYAFDRAFRQKRRGKYDNCRIILHALSQLPQEGATYAEIFSRIGLRNYPKGNLSGYLRELMTEGRGSIIRFDSASGKFAFADPIYRAFCLIHFEKHPLAVMGPMQIETFDWSLKADDLLKEFENLTFGTNDFVRLLTLEQQQTDAESSSK